MNKITVTAYQPQSNGAVENAVQSVKRVMSKYIIKNPETWKQNLHWVEFDINTSMAVLTGETPFFLDHMRDPLLPVDTEMLSTEPLEEDISVHPYIEETLHVRTEIRKIVKVQQEKEKKRQQEEMKKRLKQRRDNLEIGTRVWVKVTPGEQRPMQPKWKGPYRVVGKPTELTRELDLGTVGNQYEIFHLDKLKPYYESSELQKQAKHPQGIEAPRVQKEPVMERVLNQKEQDGTIYYLVKLRHGKAKDARWYEEKYIPPALMNSWRTRQSYKQQPEKRSAQEAPHSEDITANIPKALVASN
ncbi:hypothetical protein Pelo_18454 [Pelomyxa schiedti]|nr:hypothetical protein Pelo_18454 [Pelomyxa schiedti]